jgi:hypothetical protein
LRWSVGRGCYTEKDWATIEFLGRAPVKTIKRLVDAWSAAERALLATGSGKASIVSSYNCRDIKGGAGRSLHAFRLALDIDPGPNRRQGKGARMDWGKCKITRDQVRAVEAIRKGSGAQVSRSGVVFKNPDPMRFQIVCRKADVDSGINWATVQGSGGTSSPLGPSTGVKREDETVFVVYKDGIDNPDKAETVKYWRTKLAALGYDTGGVDGRYHSDGMRIGGVEAAQIDVALAKLGPEARGGVSHQHEEYAPLSTPIAETDDNPC